MINPIAILASDIPKRPIIEGQFLYCTDTREAYYDISNINRLTLGCTLQLDTEYEKSNLSYKQENKIYIVRESNKIYRYKNNEFNEVITHIMILDLIIDVSSLPPAVMTKDGKNIAPITIAKEVYTSDGDNVENKLLGMMNDNKKILLYTRTDHVIATHDGQRVFSIPFPIPNYDLAIYPMLIVYKDRIISSKDITISNEQVILGNKLEGLKKDELLTFIFHYNVIISNDSLNAETINNVRFIVSHIEPYDKRETDVWFDTKQLSVKQYRSRKWEIIVKSTMVDEYPFYIIKKSFTLSDTSTYVEIGIPGFDSNKDTLLVYANSTYLEEGEDYIISIDNNHIINTDGDIWNGDFEEVVFNFVVFKATNKDSKSKIIKQTILVDTVTDKLRINNYDKYRDTLFVYENSIYLEEGDDYSTSDDGKFITNNRGRWDGVEDELLFNIVIIKNTQQHLNEEIQYANEILKNQVYNTLDITEEEFNRLKDLIKTRG